ncbi:MAG: hypothetical protein JWO80_1885 [Bryobacterales bacterium]|nr:hypothetical protein [Bryobacterales bacterium]
MEADAAQCQVGSRVVFGRDDKVGHIGTNRTVAPARSDSKLDTGSTVKVPNR